MKASPLKIMISTVCLALSINTWADISSDLVNQCNTIVNMSDTQFLTQAANLNSVLDSCLANNVCSQISNSNCSNIISTRDYLSNYLAAAPANPPQFGAGNLFPSTPDTSSAATARNQDAFSTNVNANNFNNTDNTNSGAESSNTNSNKEIHWF